MKRSIPTRVRSFFVTFAKSTRFEVRSSARREEKQIHRHFEVTHAHLIACLTRFACLLGFCDDDEMQQTARNSDLGKTTFAILAVLASLSSDIAFGVDSYAPVVSRVIPGVVNIRSNAVRRIRPKKLDPYQFFLQGEKPRSESTYSLGSGIILDKKGHILTNFHVIADATSIDVLFAKTRRMVPAKVIGSDIKTDLALLKVSTKYREFRPLDMGNSDRLKVGDVVLAVGNPFGYSHTVTSGIISAKGRVIGSGPFDNFLQTDAPIHPGNSGGPLVDYRGRVIGINTAVQEGVVGIGFAIPANIAKKVIKDLMKHGKVIRPWLGMIAQNVQSVDEFGTVKDSGGVYGIIVTNLIADGPAATGGLKIGDLLMTFGGKKVYDLFHIQRLLSSKNPSDQVRVKLYRKGKGVIHKTIKLTKTPAQKDIPNTSDLF